MKLIFYYEYKNLVGGVTSLYITLFEELVKRNINFLFFNYSDGIVKNELEKKGIIIPVIDIPTFKWEELSRLVSSNDVVVLSSFDECFYKFIKINPKIIYYNINDYLGEISKYKLGLNLRFLARPLIEKLDKSNSLILMDDTGIINARKNLNYQIKNINFLPVPIKEANINYYKVPTETLQVIRLSYVGRSVDWKMMPLKKILQDLNELRDYYRIYFTIVVDNEANLRNYINLPVYESDNLKIVIKERVNPNELPNLLLDTTDIGFGMGTVVLDYGKVGIPAILIDAGKNEFPINYKYRWSFETELYNLGKFIDNYEGEFKGFTLDELLNKATKELGFLKKISAEIYAYTNNNHGVQKFVEKLLGYAENTVFRLRDAKPYVMHYQKFHQTMKKVLQRIIHRSVHRNLNS